MEQLSSSLEELIHGSPLNEKTPLDINQILFQDLDIGQKRKLGRLDSFQAPYLEEKLLKDKAFQSASDYQEAFTEFKKYVALAILYGDEKKITMTNKLVDSVWHQFILFTSLYHKFCEEFLGSYLHHAPTTSHTPRTMNGKTHFLNLYKQTFREVPGCWESDSTGITQPPSNALSSLGYCTGTCED